MAAPLQIGLFMLLLTVMLMDVLTGMEFDLFVPSFPQLQAHFGLTPFWVEALLSVNFIGYFLSLFLVGALSDRYGRRLVILVGLLAFVIGSLLCLGVDHYWALLLGRFLQGLGIAAPAILSFLIIADLYPLRQQQFLMAMLNGAMNIAVGVAPVIGSYLTLYFHWHGNFVALLLLGLLALLMTFCFVPKHISAQHQDDLAMAGYAAIFKSKPLMLLLVAFVLLCVPYWVFVGLSPLLYIKDLGVSLAHFGYYQGILAFVFALGSIGFGLLFKRYEFAQIKTVVFNNFILVLSFVAILCVALFAGHHPLLITLAVLIFVIGQIIPSVILYPLSLNMLPGVKGRVSALIQAGRLLLTAFVLQLAGHFYNGTFLNVAVFLLIFIFLSIVSLVLIVKKDGLVPRQ